MTTTSTTDFILESLKKQGFNVVILCIAIWWFNQKYEEQQEQINSLNTYIRTEFKNVVERNTEAYNKFNETINKQDH